MCDFGLCSYDNLKSISCFSVLSMLARSPLKTYGVNNSFFSWGFVISDGLVIRETYDVLEKESNRKRPNRILPL